MDGSGYPKGLKGEEISDIRDVNKHVATKGKRSWGLIGKGCASCAAHGVHCDGESTVNQILSLDVIAWARVRIKESIRSQMELP